MKVRALPDNFVQYGNENSLKFGLWNEIQDAVKLAKKIGLCGQEVDSSIIQINIGLKDNSLNDHLMVINDLSDQLELLHLSQKRYPKNDLSEMINKKVKML